MLATDENVRIQKLFKDICTAHKIRNKMAPSFCKLELLHMTKLHMASVKLLTFYKMCFYNLHVPLRMSGFCKSDHI